LAGKKVQSIPIRCPLLKGRIDIVARDQLWL
jgi:hypothetical protein